MITIKVFFPRIMALSSNFQKKEGETPPSTPFRRIWACREGSIFSYRESFLYTGGMSTNFETKGKIDETVDLFS